MKKLFLLFFLTIISLTSTAQYRKIPLDTNHYWQQHYVWTTNLAPVICDYQLRVKYDIIIDSKTYQFVEQKYAFCNSNGFTESAFIRQDTILKIVVKLIGNQEKILYNFNKNVGDTAKLLTEGGSMGTFTLQSKDSVLLNDGFYHKRYNFGSILPIIEGVGSTRGFLTPYFEFETNHQVYCFAQINPTLTIYSSGGLGTNCPIITDLNSSSTDYKKFISIFPNPTSDILNIKTESTIPKSIQIKNILGQTILSINNLGQDITTLNIKDFAQGIYFITVNLADKNISGHFIKN